MASLSFAMEAEDCRRWAEELAVEPEQRLLEKLASEFALLAAAENAPLTPVQNTILKCPTAWGASGRARSGDRRNSSRVKVKPCLTGLFR